MKGRFKGYKVSQSTIEYALLLAGVAIIFIVMAAPYIARGLRGQIQTGGDQIADQYAWTNTEGNEFSFDTRDTIELNLPGWSHPITHTRTKGFQNTSSLRKLRPLR